MGGGMTKSCEASETPFNDSRNDLDSDSVDDLALSTRIMTSFNRVMALGYDKRSEGIATLRTVAP
eukprot:CAMPEP_0201499910 /NCGR_PEP_ID=MMETSP0151_2-20130828/78668_1 /ASSEMBLY_ACC=CAM_ASM_000257 /TAXON_ID=200890 /ORGANISM="Paramoeba atlantica, Strain 621/1 / CCAP 1560/9" /LENGTH=64 /DNA_ID=CAMNT_0047892683 /DNA_START=213 /DNA_END=407 /DNA_ORIENTATION=-